MRLTAFLLSGLLMLTLVSCAGNEGKSSSADSSDPTTEADQVRDFAQEFYAWYVPLVHDSHSGRSSDIALQGRSSSFEPSLARQLKEDSDAQARNHDEIVGLDFDPFLASQDPCERYEVMNVRKKDQSYFVDVRGVGGCGEEQPGPDLAAEIISMNGSWLFTNFHYPSSLASDLRTILQELRDARK